jgi:hypothetical protein
MARKRTASAFSLSFLDIMFCGFGAVVLLVMLLSREVLVQREVRQSGLREDLMRAALKHELAREDIEALGAKLAEMDSELKLATARATELRAELSNKQGITAERRRQAKASLERLRSVVEEKRAAEQTKKQLDAQQQDAQAKGQNLIGFTGDGRRQYLTGLKLGGERTLILLDVSASMLDETIVNIVRRKLQSATLRRSAPKWQRAVRSMRWLLANLQRGKRFQVYTFNTQAQPLIAGSKDRWLSAKSAKTLAAAVDALEVIAPHKGTNLTQAFAVVRSLDPPPDSVILLTDGLPTQGNAAPGSYSVSAAERSALFEKAIGRLGKGIPVNTLLFPIEGDPDAAEAYWRLAIQTQGSFITPSRDWP